MEYKGFKGSIEFSEEDNCFYGKILDIEDLVTYEANDEQELQIAFQEAVDDYIETK